VVDVGGGGTVVVTSAGGGTAAQRAADQTGADGLAAKHGDMSGALRGNLNSGTRVRVTHRHPGVPVSRCPGVTVAVAGRR
jgi:hypothetical protein